MRAHYHSILFPIMETGFTLNAKTIVIIAVVVMAAFFIYFWMKQNQLNQEIRRLRAERDEAESNYLKLLENYMLKIQPPCFNSFSNRRVFVNFD